MLFQPSQTPQNLFKVVEDQVYEFWYFVLDHANPRTTSIVAVGWVKPPVS